MDPGVCCILFKPDTGCFSLIHKEIRNKERHCVASTEATCAELLKKYPQAIVTAMDYSSLSVQKAKEYNQSMIDSGRCRVIQGDVSELPLESDSFELVTAFETIYFWPGLEKCFFRVAEILKTGGYFMICNESDGTDQTSKKFESIIDGMKCYTTDEITAALKSAGFSEVRSDHHPSKPWITLIAKKQ